MTEPARVRGQGREQPIRDFRRDGWTERVNRLMHEPTRRLSRGVDEPRRTEVVLRNVMIDDHFRTGQRLHELAELAELAPCTRVDHDNRVSVAVLVAGFL